MLVRNRREWLADLAWTAVRRQRQAGRFVGYIGWTISTNLGDRVMLEAARKLFHGRDLEVFRGIRRETLLAGAGLSGGAAFSEIYLGGGTLINDGYLGAVERALNFGVPVSTLGTGAGSAGFTSMDERVSPGWRDVFKKFGRIGVRGPRSLEKLRAIGIDNGEVIGDLALALTPDTPIGDTQSGHYLFNAAAPDSRAPGFPAKQVSEELVRAVRRMAELGWRPTPVAFCHEDIESTRKVLSEAGIAGAKIELPESAAEFFALARGAGFSIGVRLHCAVLSCCAGVIPLSVAYREKGLDFAESMDLTRWTFDLHSLKGGILAEAAAELAEAPASAGAALHAKALEWRETLRRYTADA